MTERQYIPLKVPFDEKDIAKAEIGAKWDAKAKQWYSDDRERIKAWPQSHVWLTHPDDIKYVRKLEREWMERTGTLPEETLAGRRAMAKAGKLISMAAQSTPGGRIYLTVPFAEKDKAKSLVNAKWDGDVKRWYSTRAELSKHPESHKWIPSGPLKRELESRSTWLKKNKSKLEV